MKKIIFDGAYGIKSFGDDAPLIVLADLLREKLGNIEAIVVARHADEGLYLKYGIRSINGLEYEAKEQSIGKWFRGFNPGDDKTDLCHLYNEIANSDLLVLGAGNFMADYTIDLLKGPVPRFLALSLMAKMVGTPVMWYGISVGPLKTQLGRDMSRLSAGLASMITVRDSKSLEELEKLGVREVAYQLPDPVYGLKMPPKGYANKFAAWRDAHVSNQPVIAVSVRSIPSGAGIDTQDFISVIAKTCDILASEFAYRILFIPQCIYEHGNREEDDRNIANEIINRASNKENIFTIEEDIDVLGCASLYEGATAALCTRLHGNVFAAMQHVPVVGINYNPKVREFHKWLGTEEAVVEMLGIYPQALVDQINCVIRGKNTFKEKSKKIFEIGVPDVKKYADYAIAAMTPPG